MIARRSRSALAAVALATLVVAFTTSTFVVAAPPAGAWTEGQCTDATGVTVVIDFQELGGGVHVRCAPGPVSTGFDALTRAGINFQTTVRFPGFLCKIAGLPENDPCQTASPASAYWSYWLAARGGQWCYSNWGAGNRTPPPGSVEGWSFSLNRDGSTSPSPRYAVPAPLPGTSPPPLAGNDCDPRSDAPAPTPNPPADPGGSGGGSIGGSGGSAGASGGAAGSGGTTSPSGDGGSAPAPGGGVDAGVPGAADPSTPGATLASGDPAATTTVPSLGEAPAATGPSATEAETSTTTADGDDPVEQARAVDLSSDGASGGGSPVGVIVASALVVVLGGAAFYVRRRAARS